MKIIQTQRLVLRTFTENDISAMTMINQDPKVCEFLPQIGNHQTTAAIIKHIIAHHKKQGFSLYAVELKKNAEFIGWTGLNIADFLAHFTPAVEIGWRLASQHWRQGYATEAACAVRDYAFDELKLAEIVSFTATHNMASRRVMEKTGLTHHQQDDFDHPKLPQDSPLLHHVLYRLSQEDYQLLR